MNLLRGGSMRRSLSSTRVSMKRSAESKRVLKLTRRRETEVSLRIS
jgi:hypothetical protein